MADFFDDDLLEGQLQLMEVPASSAASVLDGGPELANIVVDRWGNEWDDSSEFLDIDFRTVDD